MSQHPNAKLTPKGRETLVSRIGSGLGVAEAARQMGVSRQTASKWLVRARRGEGLADRSSRPRRLARLTPPEVEERACEARRAMLLAPLALAAETGVPARTCARIVARHSLPRLADIDRVTGEVRRRGPVTAVRYERERPGSSSTSTSRRWRAYPTAAATGPSGAAAAPRAGPGSRACTWRSTTTAASPTPSCCPTRGRARPAASCPGRSRSTRGWASPWSGS